MNAEKVKFLRLTLRVSMCGAIFTLLSFSLGSLFTGCSSMSNESQKFSSRPVPPGFARVFIHRSPFFVAGGFAPHLAVDGIEKGVLRRRGVFAVDISAGQHVIAITGSLAGSPSSPALVHIDAVSGTVLHYRYGAILQEQKIQSKSSRIKTITIWQFGLYPEPPEGASDDKIKG